MRGSALPALAAAWLALGCTARIVESRRRTRGPVGEVGWIDPGGGHAVYSLRGPGWVARARREDAMTRIAVYCGGKERFKIVDELDREDPEALYSAGELEESVGSGSRHYRKEKNRHLYFECLP